MYRDDIKQEMAEYRKEYDEKLPKRQLFMDAMNEVFTLQHNLRFDDYIQHMVDLGNEHSNIPAIQVETRKILEMIVDCVRKLNKNDQRSLEKKLNLAIKEYNY